MIKNVLFAGKDFPSGEQYLSSASDTGLTALITCPSDENDNGNPQILSWNRGSVVSSHSLVIQAENSTAGIDAACLIFDAPHFSKVYADSQKSSAQIIVNDLILSYQLLAKALIDRFIIKKHGKMAFLLRASALRCESGKKNTPVNVHTDISAAMLASAEAAFESFAENFASVYAASLNDKILLIRAEDESDRDTADFVCRKLASDADKNTKKSTKDAVKWISVSGKDEGAFNFFKRL